MSEKLKGILIDNFDELLSNKNDSPIPSDDKSLKIFELSKEINNNNRDIEDNDNNILESEDDLTMEKKLLEIERLKLQDEDGEIYKNREIIEKQIAKQQKERQKEIKEDIKEEKNINKSDKINQQRVDLIKNISFMANDLNLSNKKDLSADNLSQLTTAQLLEIELQITNAMNKKMDSLSKHPQFLTHVVVNMAGMLEKIPHLKGLKSNLDTQKDEIEKCLDQMIKEGKLEKLQKYMTPENKLMVIIGGCLLTTVSRNTAQQMKKKSENILLQQPASQQPQLQQSSYQSNTITNYL